MNLYVQYNRLRNTPSDINEHMPVLRAGRDTPGIA